MGHRTRIIAASVFSLLIVSCSQEGMFSQASEKSETRPVKIPSTSTVVNQTNEDPNDSKVVVVEEEEELQDLQPLTADVPNTNDPSSVPGLEDLFKTDPASQPPPPPKTDPADTPPEPAVNSLEAWCKGAAEARQMSKAGLKALHAELCTGDKPTELFSKTLIAAAYSGAGALQFTPLRNLGSDRATNITSVRFAFAIKIPIDVKAYFDKVSPKAVEPEALKAVVEGPGGTATVEVLENYTKDGPHHVRGVLANQVLLKQVRGRNVTVESDTRTDHHMIADGQAYMFTATVMRAVSSIIHNDTLSALVKVDGESYFINVVDAAVPNRGFENIAEQELARSSQAGANALYQRIVTNSMP